MLVRGVSHARQRRMTIATMSPAIWRVKPKKALTIPDYTISLCSSVPPHSSTTRAKMVQQGLITEHPKDLVRAPHRRNRAANRAFEPTRLKSPLRFLWQTKLAAIAGESLMSGYSDM
ncbi:hypothetical protein KC360_g59 [Hortaea werneckii]|nr:hypothetical protein KC344_g57 [Hortaea werneckii]KAI7180493.1 hypothetical protein KC360_g59 [Hortaea werneckii]